MSWRLIVAFCLALGWAGTLTPAASAADAKPDPRDLRTLAELLDKPAIRAWLQEQAKGTSGTAADPAASAKPEASGMHEYVAERLDITRAFIRSLVAAAPGLAEQLSRARSTLMSEFERYGLWAITLPLFGFILLGAAVEALAVRLTAPMRRRFDTMPLETVEQRLRAVGIRSLYGLAMLLAFTVGSIGAFLAFNWPPLLQKIVVSYLLVFLAVRLVLVAGLILLAPRIPRFRVLPVDTPTARYWFVWSAVLVGYFVFAKTTFDLLPSLQVDRASMGLVGIELGFVLLLLALIAIARRPTPEGAPPTRLMRDGVFWGLGGYLVVLWLTIFTGTTVAFYLGIALLGFVLANLGIRAAVGHLLHPPEATVVEERAPPVMVVAVDRTLRIVLLIILAFAVARILGWDINEIVEAKGGMRAVRAALSVVLIALVADLAWRIMRTWIDHRMEDAGQTGGSSLEEVRHRQRVRTLLPILRNVLLIALIVVAALMALSTAGVEIGPLIAGAGVLGIAVGFGAQTLVKDVISGMFYLFDDAFRIGEYIESGRIKGTVEAFSLRSIKLRHHRGPLHTVPFGQLGTITNYSRDWVIDKMSLSLTYDTDLGKVKQIIKEIGKQLASDPEFGSHILETLKMQGVEQFGDFAIQIRLKMKTRPGEQFVIRRRAYALIKEAFKREGIRIALPTVTVAGGSPGEPGTDYAAANMARQLAANAPAQ